MQKYKKDGPLGLFLPSIMFLYLSFAWSLALIHLNLFMGFSQICRKSCKSRTTLTAITKSCGSPQKRHCLQILRSLTLETLMFIIAFLLVCSCKTGDVNLGCKHLALDRSSPFWDCVVRRRLLITTGGKRRRYVDFP